MSITFEQILASAIKYVQDNADSNAEAYFEELPENFAVPSLYFPTPRTSTRKVTLETYLTMIDCEVWFMASTDWDSQKDAEKVRDSILLDDCWIDMLNEDGTEVGLKVRLTEPETSFVDTGITKLSFGIKHYFSKEKEPVMKMNKFNLNETGKQNK